MPARRSGWGGSSTSAGNPCQFSALHGETYNCPAEVAEARYGVTVDYLSFHDEDGGAGFHRGGKGVRIDYRLEDAEQYLAEDSYLQLVRLPADGRLHYTTDDQGRLAYDSELAQIPIPHDGVFTFQVESLEPGAYLIAAQSYLLAVGSTPLGVKEAELVAIEIPQDTNLPLSFDLGEVAIYVPFP